MLIIPLVRIGNGEYAVGQGELLVRTVRVVVVLAPAQQQRVGLARALARRPAVYLLDEPTAHLDTVLKADLQSELAHRMHADGAAAIHATHDVEEAIFLADKILVLSDGPGTILAELDAERQVARLRRRAGQREIADARAAACAPGCTTPTTGNVPRVRRTSSSASADAVW